MALMPSMSLSSFDSSNSSLLSASSCVSLSSVTTTASRDFFSRPSSWARFGSFQTLGSSSAAFTSLRRFALTS
jgi:hypothetical protein